MKLTIENKSVVPAVRHKDNGEWAAFIAAVPKLQVGQSFIITRHASNYRLASAIAKSWLGIQLIFAKEGKNFRVGRTA